MKRLSIAAGLLFVVLAGASCGDDLDGGANCPGLCPEQSLPVQDTVLNAVALDTTVGPFPVLGTEAGLLLASRGDSIDVRGVVRFDTLSKTFVFEGDEEDISAVDSSRLFIRIDTAAVNFTGSASIEVYDVDTTAADTNTAAIAALFRPGRLLGSVNITRNYFFLDDSLSIPIPNAFVLGKIQSGGRVRLGMRFVGDGDITVLSIERGLPPALVFDPAPGNTSLANRNLAPLSNTPVGDPLTANDLRDYSVVVQGMDTPTERLSIGGLPAHRTYLRFSIPRRFLDSVTIVRAQLVLVQRPVSGIDDTVGTVVYPAPVSTTPAVTDIRRQAQLAYPIFSFGLTGLVLTPTDSGPQRFDMVGVLRHWQTTSQLENKLETALVLRGANEGRTLGRISFFGLDAPAELRPQLRLSYVARSRFGIP